jgi:hypothetical protein
MLSGDRRGRGHPGLAAAGRGVEVRLAVPQRVQGPAGHACAYLASDAAANITGEALNVSGGQQMH